MPTVRVVSVMLRVMPMLRVLQVMLWLIVPLMMPMGRVLQMMLRLTVLLVMMMVRVLQVLVLGVGPCLGGRWPVLGVGPSHSWMGAWRVTLLAGWPTSPVSASGDTDGEGAVGDILGVVVTGDADGEGVAGDAMRVAVSADACGEGAFGDGVVNANGEGVALGGRCQW